MTRDRLTHGIYRTIEPSNPLGLLQEALVLADTAEPLEKRVRVEGVKTGRITALDLPGQIQQALAAGILSETEAAMLRDYDRRVMDIIHVDDFTTEEMAAGEQPVDVARRASATREVAPSENHPARRHGRVLRVRRSARQSGAARQAADRRRHRAVAASSPRPATKCASTACTRRCRCAKRCAAARTRSACGRASSATRQCRDTVFGVFHEYTPLVQGLSLDEAFLDVTESQAALGDGPTIAVAIKKQIVERTGLTASVGVAPNKLVAKIASDLRKPDGLVVVRERRSHRAARSAADPQAVRHRQQDRAASRTDRHPHVARPAARAAMRCCSPCSVATWPRSKHARPASTIGR